MPQFTIYKSSDSGALPLSGSSGSLLRVLDSCLVTGYGTQGGAGWTKPIANYSNGTIDVAGCWQQPSGSGLVLFMNDNALITHKEARITGFDSITSFDGGFPTGSNPFPSGSQGTGFYPNGPSYVIARKSADITTARPWIVAADSSSFYMFVLTGDNASNYLAFSFGDFYSIKTGSVDQYRCMIAGRSAQDSATITNDGLDKLSALGTGTAGNFAAHSFNGLGVSILISKHGDGVKGSTTQLLGTTQYLNGADGGIYISPVWVCESATSTIRGRMRGFYQQLHAIGSFPTDGQIITGEGGYSGKTFLIIRLSGSGGIYVIETSNTLETN